MEIDPTTWFGKEEFRSIGFIKNPYKKWDSVKFRHIFAFDQECNLYVGQFSVYLFHIRDMYPNVFFREKGYILPKKEKTLIKYSKEYADKFGLSDYNIQNQRTLVLINDFIVFNVTNFTKRLRLIAQRLYDYGLPTDSIILSTDRDLGRPTLKIMRRYDFIENPYSNKEP